MSGFLTGVVSITDHEGNRVDTPNVDGDHAPVELQLGSTMTATKTTNGSLTRVTLNATGGAGGIVLALDTHDDFRELEIVDVPDGTVIHFKTPVGVFVYEDSLGAGQVDDDRTILKLDDVSTGANGRAYSVNAPILPTIASLRLAVSGKNEAVEVQTFSTAGDGGGGQFIKQLGSATDNGGTIIVPTGVTTFYYERQYTGPISPLWFGLRADGVTNDHAAIVATIAALDSARGGGVLFDVPGAREIFLSTTIALSGLSNLSISSKRGCIIRVPTNVPAFEFTDCDNVSITGIHIIGTIQTDGMNVGGGNTSQAGVRLISGCTNVDIHDNVFQDLGGYGVFIRTLCVDITVRNNRFQATGAGCQTGAGPDIINTNLKIVDNTFIGFIPPEDPESPGDIDPSCIGTVGSDDQIALFGGVSGTSIISRNHIDKRGIDTFSQTYSQAKCITVEAGGTGAPVSEIIVSDNFCLNSYSSGVLNRQAIFLSTAGLASISVIKVDRNVIRRAGGGITLDAGGATVTDIAIEGNSIHDLQGTGSDYHGIQLGASDAATITRAVVRNNSIVGVANGCGIFAGSLANVDHVRITGNTAVDCVAGGIKVDQVSSGIDVDVSGNTVTGVTGSAHGIYVANTTDVRVNSNRVEGCTVGNGFFLLTCTNVQASENRVDSCVNGFRVSSCVNPILSNNIVTGSSNYDGLFVGTSTGARVCGNKFVGSFVYQDTSGDIVYVGNGGTFYDFSTTCTISTQELSAMTPFSTTAGGALTMSAYEGSFERIKFTGSPGGALSVVVPASASVGWVKTFWNASGQTVTVKGSGGDTGVAVTNGITVMILSDGTNCRASAGTPGATGPAGSIERRKDDIGGATSYGFAGSSPTTTLTQNYTTVWVSCDTTESVTLKRTGATNGARIRFTFWDSPEGTINFFDDSSGAIGGLAGPADTWPAAIPTTVEFEFLDSTDGWVPSDPGDLAI